MTDARFYGELWAGAWRGLPERGPLGAVRQRLVLRELRPFLRAGERLLDVGCGDGTFLALLRRRHPEVRGEGVDFAPEAVESASAELRGLIRVGDVERLSELYPPESFGLAVSSEVLEHVGDPAAVVRGVAAVLRPGGTAVFTVPLGMRHWSDLDDAGGHLRRFELDEMAALLQANGLVTRRCYGWGGPFALPYYALTKRLGARRVSAAAQSRLSWALSRVAQGLFRIDDLFPSRFGFQLIAVAGRRG